MPTSKKINYPLITLVGWVSFIVGICAEKVGTLTTVTEWTWIDPIAMGGFVIFPALLGWLSAIDDRKVE